MTDPDPFIAGLPKAELHVHHIGSASPRIVAELAARHEGSSPVPADPAALAVQDHHDMVVVGPVDARGHTVRR